MSRRVPEAPGALSGSVSQVGEGSGVSGAGSSTVTDGSAGRVGGVGRLAVETVPTARGEAVPWVVV